MSTQWADCSHYWTTEVDECRLCGRRVDQVSSPAEKVVPNGA